MSLFCQTSKKIEQIVEMNLLTTTSPSSGVNFFSRASKSGKMCIQLIQQYVKKSISTILPLRCSEKVSRSETLNHSKPVDIMLHNVITN